MTQIREEAYFTKGRVIVRGKTLKRDEEVFDDVAVHAGTGADEDAGDVDHLLPEYEKLLARSAETRNALKAQLMEALSR